MLSPIYLDYAATTPVDPRVAERMSQCLTMTGTYANPASSHGLGKTAKMAVEHARAQVADLLHADPNEIIWTSGATEANNLALKGAASLYQSKGKHIVTVKTEHPSVLDTCQYLEKQGYFVTYLTPKANGLIDLEEFKAALRPDTLLVSIMHMNNEIGVIQDIASIANITAERGVLFHVDAAQSIGKLPLDMSKTPIDLLSLSAHKVYGPKGIGALYIRRKPRVRVAPQMHGGGQEMGMRSGTLATHQMVGMGEALALAKSSMLHDVQYIKSLRDQFLQRLTVEYHTNGDLTSCYPGILNIRFESINAHDLLNAVPQLALSVGSACMSKGNEPSYVLRALGQSDTVARQGIRISFGRYTTEQDINIAADNLQTALTKINCLR